MPKNRKLALNSGIQTNQILTNDDEVCIPRLSSILLAVCMTYVHCSVQDQAFVNIKVAELLGY